MLAKDHIMDEYNLNDQFPIGMRILAVDDDSTCLMILETLLRRCQYNVSGQNLHLEVQHFLFRSVLTTAKSAVSALELLRQSKNKFDLVISDVHMPDMDGFKLLELVGLELDLPVIMLSVNDDPKMVMKGVTHGACDYLLKPVRIEELRNIWQHVIRKKKSNKTSDQDKSNADSSIERGSVSTENSDQNGKSSKKRKDQDEDDGEEHESSHDNVDSSTNKKLRIVWNAQLHRKFVAAVSQLGIDKAVPKKILDLMNEERLTRENKYRLYLKRIRQQTNTMSAVAVSSADTSYLRMGSLSRHLPTLSGPQDFCNNAFRSCPPYGISSRSNTSVALNVHGLPPSETPQFGGASQNGIQGLPIPIGQHNTDVGASPIQNLTPLLDVKSTFYMSNKLPKLPDQIPEVTMACSPSQLLDISTNSLILKKNPQDTQGSRVYENLTSVTSSNSQFSLPLLDHGRCSDSWSSSMQSFGTSAYHTPSKHFREAIMHPTDNMSSANLQGGDLSAASSVTSLSSQSYGSLTDMHSHGVIFTNNTGQISNNVPFQGWDHHNQGGSYHSHVIGNSLISADCNVDPEGHTSMNSTFNRNLDFSFCDPLQMKHNGVMGLSEETSLKSQEGYNTNLQKSENSCITDNNLGSLEDLVSAMMKQHFWILDRAIYSLIPPLFVLNLMMLHVNPLGDVFCTLPLPFCPCPSSNNIGHVMQKQDKVENQFSHQRPYYHIRTLHEVGIGVAREQAYIDCISVKELNVSKGHSCPIRNLFQWGEKKKLVVLVVPQYRL
ncbi:hypothetical protein VNO77_30346 [Canavalia gladiata]|uniref:Response regulatory domain-containing protein n=1 Tax=Canavalia gladiata TaxID=3824 RepID=A0AAN9KRR4_CANGL